MLFHVQIDAQKFNINLETLEDLMALLEKHQCEDLVISWAEQGRLPCLTSMEPFIKRYLKDYPVDKLIDYLDLRDYPLNELIRNAL